MRRALIFIVLAVALVTAGCLPPPTDPGGGGTPSPSMVYPARTRVVCRIPMSGNPQKDLGFDTGFSFKYNDNEYWAAGDSLLDANGDGVADGGFMTGSIGKVSDKTAHDCVNVSLRTTTGSNIKPVLTPDKAHGECLVWPTAPFDANGKLYFFYTSVHKDPDCGKTRPTTYQQGLGQLTDPTSTDLAPVRVTMGLMWGAPIKANARLYLFRLDTETHQLYMARVNEAKFPNESQYQFWTGTDWSVAGDAAAARPMMENVTYMPKISFSTYLNRYMMVYPCGFWLSAVCAQTAKTTGDGQAALFGGWNDSTELLHCVYFGCGHSYWHNDYTDSAHPDRIYISTANFPGRSYYVNLYEVSLSDRPAPASRVYVQGDTDFDSSSNSGGAWSYVGYDPARAATTIAPLTIKSVGPPSLTDGKDRPPAWTGNETVPDSAFAPGVFAQGMWPSDTRAAGRVWTAPSNGTVEISGNTWLESTKGDGAQAEVLRIHGTTVTSLWTLPLDPKWTPTRNLIVHLENVSVQTGDKIVLGVRKGTNDKRNATKDLTYFLTSLTFDPS